MDRPGLYASLRRILPWIITAALLVIVFRIVGWKNIVDNLSGESVRNVVILGLLFYTFIFLANSFIYFQIFRMLDHPIPYKEIFLIRGASYLLTAINPGVGQGGMALWISRKKSIPFKKVIGMMLILPVVDITCLAIILSVSLIVNYTSGGMLADTHAALLLWAVALMWLVLLLHFIFWKANFLAGVFIKLRESDFLIGYRNAKTGHYLLLGAIRMVMQLTLVFSFYFGLIFFHVKLPFWIYLVRFFPAIIIQAIPVTVGQFGTSQGAWILMYRDLVDPSRLAAFSLLWITVYNINRLLIGAICFREEAKYYFNKDGRPDADKMNSPKDARED